ncbi:MAG: hypothetical protein JWM85_2259, partial [Acidimicrobiaceae bacterium]|nr:hypothetical protein [Acidimicrobiaceae bacterium]
ARKQQNRGLIGWGAVALVAIVVVVLVVVKVTSSSTPSSSSSKSNGVTTGQDPLLAPAAYVNAITTIPTSTYNSVGTDAQPAPFVVTKGQAPLTSGGKPRFVYVGAEYCPYCAMMRYTMVAALSRFGTFTGLKETTSGSSDGNVPTFSFLGSTYKSPYVTFSPYEEEDRQEPTPQLLQSLPTDVNNLVAKYDGSGTTPAVPFNTSAGVGIPFEDIGNKYVSSGSPSAFANLWTSGQPLNNGGPGRLAIAEGIHNPNSATGKYIQGALFVAQANYITAAICNLDGGKPASVCNTSGVKAAQKSLAAVKPVS